MTKKTVRFLTKLSIATISILSLCGWAPLTAPVTIHSDPSDATVSDVSSGTVLGTTPFDTRVFTGEKFFRVSKLGYFSKDITLNHSSARDVSIKLDQIFPAVIKSQPENATVYKPGTDTPVGQTPFTVDTSKKDTELTLKLFGYHDESVTVKQFSSETSQVTFKRLPTIIIQSTPEGATVMDNGQVIGTTPLQTKAVTERTLQITEQGYFDKDVTVSYNTAPSINVDLQKLPVITLTATPTAEVYRDGKRVAETPIKLAVKKEITLTLKADRYYDATVQVSPTSPREVKTTLKPKPYTMIKSSPAAQVFNRGTLLGTTPLELLADKNISLELRKEGYESESCEITKGVSKTINVELTEIPVVVEVEPTNIVTEVVEAAPVVEEEVVVPPVTEDDSKGINPLIWIGAGILLIGAIAIPLLKKKN